LFGITSFVAEIRGGYFSNTFKHKRTTCTAHVCSSWGTGVCLGLRGTVSAAPCY